MVVDVNDTDLIVAEGFIHNKMHCHLPIISIDGNGDRIYLKAVQKFGDESGFLFSLDMCNKAVRVLAPLSSSMDRANRPRLIYFGSRLLYFFDYFNT